MNIVKTKYRGTTSYIHVLAELVRASEWTLRTSTTI
jgi:hypothetical protein